MTRVGIAGATGFIGRHLVAAVTARGDSVVTASPLVIPSVANEVSVVEGP